jgi:ankyrin repeat protein
MINKSKSLHSVVETGDKDVAEHLLASGVEVNTKDKNDRTPLHLAASLGHKEITEHLLAYGADLNITAANVCSILFSLKIFIKSGFFSKKLMFNVFVIPQN